MATGTHSAPTAAGQGGIGFFLRVPSQWYEFDIHPAVRDDNIRRAVRERVQARPELAPTERELTRALRRMCREAWQDGVVYCGCMAEMIEDEAPLVANLTVALVRARTQQGEALSTDPSVILASMEPIPRGRRPTDLWREVEVVQLPDAGPAARSRGIEDISLPDDPRMARMVMMQTFVPVPGVDDRVAVITGSSPQLELTEPMLEIFHEVTATFRFVDRRAEN
jgi:hypothetical protein